MSAVAVLVLLVGGTLAWANGSNDVSKGVATLVGSGVTDYRRAIAWGSVWTGAGGLLGAIFAGAMLATFGSGLLGADVVPSLAATLGTLLGAAGWVLLSTRTGLPVSTTHAIVGAMSGVAVLAYGFDAFQWGVLGGKILLPLLLSPVLAAGLTAALTAIGARFGSGTQSKDQASADCICAELVPAAVPVPVPATVPATARFQSSSAADAALHRGLPQLSIVQAPTQECVEVRPRAFAVTLAHAHWLTSGATSLARGMNDAPKIVAVSLAAASVGGSRLASLPLLYLVVVVGMVAGSLVAGRRVTRVLAEDVTPMDDHQGFSANLVTAALVLTGAVFGLPMSTTHVAGGGIFGAGAQRGTLDAGALRSIALAWVLTLPAAAVLGGLCWWGLSQVGL